MKSKTKNKDCRFFDEKRKNLEVREKDLKKGLPGKIVFQKENNSEMQIPDCSSPSDVSPHKNDQMDPLHTIYKEFWSFPERRKRNEPLPSISMWPRSKGRAERNTCSLSFVQCAPFFNNDKSTQSLSIEKRQILAPKQLYPRWIKMIDTIVNPLEPSDNAAWTRTKVRKEFMSFF